MGNSFSTGHPQVVNSDPGPGQDQRQATKPSTDGTISKGPNRVPPKKKRKGGIGRRQKGHANTISTNVARPVDESLRSTNCACDHAVNPVDELSEEPNRKKTRSRADDHWRVNRAVLS